MRNTYSFFILLFSLNTFSQNFTYNVDKITGSYPATDLILDGSTLTPQEAFTIYKERSRLSAGSWDLSKLDPVDTDVWKKDGFETTIPEVREFDKLKHVSSSLSRTDFYRFLTKGSGNKNYQIYISPIAHNLLVTSKLLAKLGYKVPGIKHLKNVIVEFDSNKELESFVSDLEFSIGKDSSRWIIKKEDKLVSLQDVVILEEQNTMLNLSLGVLPEFLLAENKRIFNSLLVAYAFTSLPENLNLMRWEIGEINREKISLYTQFESSFKTGLDDAKWIAEKILNLKERDLEEIADSSSLPAPVRKVLFEKLKSKRNNLALLFDIPAQTYSVEANYTDELGIVDNGNIKREFFQGYGRRLDYPDPESILSFSEMSSFFQSKLINEGVQHLVTAFNNTPFMSGNYKNKVEDIKNAATERLADALENNRPHSTAAENYTFLTPNGGVGISREVIAGNYLGTDNIIQLADSVNVYLGVGLYGGISGVYTKLGKNGITQTGEVVRNLIPVDINASTKVHVSRRYTHIRPILSIKKAMKTPFKNVMGRGQSKLFNLKNKEKLSPEDFTSFLSNLNENLDIGESLIISDSIVVGLNAGIGAKLYNAVKADLSFGSQKYVVSRTHIIRRSEKIFHIYKDLGNINKVRVSLEMNAFIPIFKAQVEGVKGKSKTKFYNIVLSDSDDLKKILAIKDVFARNSLRAMNRIKKPYEIHHKFTSKSSKIGIFVFRYNYLKSKNNISVYSPDKDKVDLFRAYKGKSKGIDYESYATDIINGLTNVILDTGSMSYSLSNRNPGNSFMGRAKNKIAVFESYIENNKVIKPFVRIQRTWNGWKKKQKKVLAEIEKLNKKYQFPFFSKRILAQTEQIFLFDLDFNVFFSKDAINYVLQLEETKIEEIFRRFNNSSTSLTPEDAPKSSELRSFLSDLKKIKKTKMSSDLRKYSDKIIDLFSNADDHLTLAGLSVLVGGKENMFARASLNGFRVGDENGDQELSSNNFGTFGNKSLASPTQEIINIMRQREMDLEGASAPMLRGEFYINWLQDRIL